MRMNRQREAIVNKYLLKRSHFGFDKQNKKKKRIRNSLSLFFFGEGINLFFLA